MDNYWLAILILILSAVSLWFSISRNFGFRNTIYIFERNIRGDKADYIVIGYAQGEYRASAINDTYRTPMTGIADKWIYLDQQTRLHTNGKHIERDVLLGYIHNPKYNQYMYSMRFGKIKFRYNSMKDV